MRQIQLSPRTEYRRIEAPWWLTIIPSRSGKIFPWGGAPAPRLLKIVLGRKVWMSWEELSLGKSARSKQWYFTEEQLKRIIETAQGQYRGLFAVLAGTGMRIGEAAGLYVEDVDIHSQVVHIRQEHLERTGRGPEDGECDPGGRHR